MHLVLIHVSKQWCHGLHICTCFHNLGVNYNTHYFVLLSYYINIKRQTFTCWFIFVWDVYTCIYVCSDSKII